MGNAKVQARQQLKSKLKKSIKGIGLPKGVSEEQLDQAILVGQLQIKKTKWDTVFLVSADVGLYAGFYKSAILSVPHFPEWNHQAGDDHNSYFCRKEDMVYIMDCDDLSSPRGFYCVPFNIFEQSLKEHTKVE